MLGKKRSASVFVPAAPASPVPNLEEKHTQKAVETIAAPAALTAIPSEEAPPTEGKPVLTGRAHSLFFTPEDDSREFPNVCHEVQGYLADAALVLEVPTSFAGSVLPPLRMQLRVQAKYIPKF